MGGWGIAETAPVIEKIKAESADYLHGLNSCGKITWSVYDEAFDVYMELISRAYEQGKKDAQAEWIPVSERLPEYQKHVLLCSTNGLIQIGFRSAWNGHWIGDLGGKLIDIVAWAEMPKPYRSDING